MPWADEYEELLNGDRHPSTIQSIRAGIVTAKQINEAWEERQEVLRKYGFVPESILPERVSTRLARDEHLDQYINDVFGRSIQSSPRLVQIGSRSRSKAAGLADILRMLGLDPEDYTPNKPGAKLRKPFLKSSHGLSQFPPEVARYCILQWSDEGDLMFDPFMERLPRILVAHILKRHAIGYDISTPFFRWDEYWLGQIRKMEAQAIITPPEAEYSIEIYHRDSRTVHLPDASVDFVFTSPPYYDVEYYGNEPEQLGNAGTYEAFLADLALVAQQCMRVLTPGKFCVWVVNDFRRDGRLIPYHADVIKMFLDIPGVVLHDLAIYKTGTLGKVYVRRNERSRTTAKAHEYILVFKR